MKESILQKLENLKERYEELEGLMSDVEVITNQDKFRAYSMEYAELEPVVKNFQTFVQVQSDLAEAQAMQKDSDPDLREMGNEEFAVANGKIENLEVELQKLLLPKDPNDSCNVFLEIRAGT